MQKPLLGLTEKIDTLRATLLLRVIVIVSVFITGPVRGKLPLWMAQWFQLISYPLFIYNIVFMTFNRKIADFLQKYPSVLLVDLFIAVGILQIGGGWRNSYFMYTLTTIMLFTIFSGKKGIFFSSVVLSAAALLKDPAGDLPSLDIFDVTDWDMRIGAALFYIAAGCILAYFHTLLDKLEFLSKKRIEETCKLTAMEEKMRLALDLHDGVKSKITAILLVFKPLFNRTKLSEHDIDNELTRVWKWLNYLKNELNYIVDSLKSEGNISQSGCNLINLAREEAKIIEGMTGFSWRLVSNPNEIFVPRKNKQSLVRFLSEALINSWKHSGSTKGTIELEYTGKSITVVVSDQGDGFIYQGGKDIKTIGLKSLKYRAQELNGNFTIETAPGKGCKLILTFPATAV